MGPESSWYVQRIPILREMLKTGGDKDIFVERLKVPVSDLGYRMITKWHATLQEANADFADPLMVERMSVSAALQEMESWVTSSGNE
jgi:hypothetical protein